MLIKDARLVSKAAIEVKESVIVPVSESVKGGREENWVSNADSEAGMRVLRDERRSGATEPSTRAKEVLMRE